MHLPARFSALALAGALLLAPIAAAPAAEAGTAAPAGPAAAATTAAATAAARTAGRAAPAAAALAAAAGYCLLFEARENGHALLGVVLHSSRRNDMAAFSDATKILDWGFRHV